MNICCVKDGEKPELPAVTSCQHTASRSSRLPRNWHLCIPVVSSTHYVPVQQKTLQQYLQPQPEQTPELFTIFVHTKHGMNWYLKSSHPVSVLHTSLPVQLELELELGLEFSFICNSHSMSRQNTTANQYTR